MSNPSPYKNTSSTEDWCVEYISRSEDNWFTHIEPVKQWCRENFYPADNGGRTWVCFYVRQIKPGSYAYLFRFKHQVDACAFKVRWC